MQVSASIELVWQLAAREALVGQFGMIEPEHFCMALLKFAELPIEEGRGVSPESQAAKQLACEVAVIRERLASRALDSMRVRRRLRALLGKRGVPGTGRRMPRSQASRDLFAAAVNLAADAGSDVLQTPHLFAALLASPTEAMDQVLGDLAGSGTPSRFGTPLLDKHGRDLVWPEANGGGGPGVGRIAELL